MSATTAGDKAMDFALEAVLPKPVADFPEYWLGQLRAIDGQERSGVLTRAQFIKEVHRVMDELRYWENKKLLRETLLAKAGAA